METFTYRLIILLFLSFQGQIAAQSTSNRVPPSYLNDFPDKALIYSGRIAVEYNLASLGTPYVYENIFREGEVFYNGKIYGGVLLNLDSVEDNLCLRLPEGKMLILNKSLVNWFFIGEREFINIPIDNRYGVQGGYYHYLFRGNSYTIIKKIRKKYVERIDSKLSTVVKEFEESSEYYLIENNNAVRVTKKSSLLKLFPRYKKELRRYLNSNRIYYRDDIELYILTIIKYIDDHE